MRAVHKCYGGWNVRRATKRGLHVLSKRDVDYYEHQRFESFRVCHVVERPAPPTPSQGETSTLPGSQNKGSREFHAGPRSRRLIARLAD